MKRRLICLLTVCTLLLSIVSIAPMPVRATSEMKVSEEAILFIKNWEGFSKHPYKDGNQYTVGYGTRCPDDLVAHYMEVGITEEEAQLLLDQLLAGFESHVNAFIDKHELTFTQQQFDAIISLVFNVGSNWLTKGETLVQALTNDVSENEFLFAMTIYSISNGVRSKGHIMRRLTEANIYLNGEYNLTPPENYHYVIYDACGGELDEYGVQGFNCNTPVEPYTTAFAEGFKFLGWFTEEEGGEKVEILDDTIPNGKYLYAHWEAENGSSDKPTRPTQPSVPSVEIVPEPEGGTKVTVTSTDVNIRTGPGTSYTVTGMASINQEITVTATASNDGYLWGQFEGGWICLKYTNYDEVRVPVTPDDPTEPPTTEPPVTEPPVTEPPVTEPPVTEPPVTEPPVTEPPVTEPPVTEPPVTEPPVTEPPVTEPPVTEPPVTEPPVTEPPVTEPPVTEPPVTEPVLPEITPEPNGGIQVTVTNTGVNIRSGPGTNYAIIGSANIQQKITITATATADNMLWGQFSGGWIALQYTDYEKVKQEAANPVLFSGTVYNAADLNIRVNAGTAYDVVGQYHNGDRVDILETKMVGAVEWGRTKLGWISLDYIKRDGEQFPNDPVVPPPPTQTWTGIVTVDDVLYIRSGAGKYHTIAGFLLNGAEITILERQIVDGVQWGRIDKGWVCLDYVQIEGESTPPIDPPPTEPPVTEPPITEPPVTEPPATEPPVTEPPAPQPFTMTVNTCSLRIRKGAGNGNAIIGYLPFGEMVEILETKTVGVWQWGRTEAGWVNMRYLR